MIKKEWMSEKEMEENLIVEGNLFENPELILTFGNNALDMAIVVSRTAKELITFLEIIKKENERQKKIRYGNRE